MNVIPSSIKTLQTNDHLLLSVDTAWLTNGILIDIINNGHY
jgi:hypothetical protein